MSDVSFHVLRVTCNMSPVTNATDHSTANSHTLYSRIVCKEPTIYHCKWEQLDISKITNRRRITKICGGGSKCYLKLIFFFQIFFIGGGGCGRWEGGEGSKATVP